MKMRAISLFVLGAFLAVTLVSPITEASPGTWLKSLFTRKSANPQGPSTKPHAYSGTHTFIENKNRRIVRFQGTHEGRISDVTGGGATYRVPGKVAAMVMGVKKYQDGRSNLVVHYKLYDFKPERETIIPLQESVELERQSRDSDAVHYFGRGSSGQEITAIVKKGVVRSFDVKRVEHVRYGSHENDWETVTETLRTSEEAH